MDTLLSVCLSSLDAGREVHAPFLWVKVLSCYHDGYLHADTAAAECRGFYRSESDAGWFGRPPDATGVRSVGMKGYRSGTADVRAEGTPERIAIYIMNDRRCDPVAEGPIG